MHITFFETTPEEQRYFSERLQKHTLQFVQEPLTEQTVGAYTHIDAACIFINSKITAAVVEQLPKLKIVTTRSTGFDHIDSKACQERSVKVCSVPDYGIYTVAEFTFTLLLALVRNVKSILTDNTSYQKVASTEFVGRELFGKTLGIIGTGKIGLHVATLAKGFGMHILAYDVIKNEEKAQSIGFSYVSLDHLLSHADVITLHVPLLPSTQHLINKKMLSTIKKGVYLINTSRGGVVETDAILEGLQNHIFSGVGLDVYEEEKTLQNPAAAAKIKKLVAHERVIVSPHIAYCTEEALRRILETTAIHLETISSQ